ncbi:hypothetical protein GW17_00035575 [Ensete ventricosum]|nr:hypothetical protein GW17_00035575 [Ensete ventricosum]
MNHSDFTIIEDNTRDRSDDFAGKPIHPIAGAIVHRLADSLNHSLSTGEKRRPSSFDAPLLSASTRSKRLQFRCRRREEEKPKILKFGRHESVRLLRLGRRSHLRERRMVRKSSQSPLAPEEPASADAAPSLPGSGSNVVLNEPRRRWARFAEMSGETAAECAAVCCCCPCGLVNLLVVVVVKLPAGLVRKALRRIRNRSRKKAAISRPKVGALNHNDLSIRRAALLATTGTEEAWPTKSPSEEILELEKVMWANFYGAGFWRSPSQREYSGKPPFQFPR